MSKKTIKTSVEMIFLISALFDNFYIILSDLCFSGKMILENLNLDRLAYTFIIFFVILDIPSVYAILKNKKSFNIVFFWQKI